jgi:FKBP-type peptidyl-prolyl cis-trans isomerase FklB
MRFSRSAVMGAGLVAITMAALAGEEKGAAPKTGSDRLESVKKKVSYGIGLSFGKQLKAQPLDLDEDVLIEGIKDAMAGKSQLNDQQITEAMLAFKQEILAQRAKGGEAMAKQGEAFLAENKKKPGVVTTKSGLQYKVLKEGSGKTPKATDTATINYEGRLIDGTVFDSSEKHGGPASLPVNGFVRGFSEALQLMKVGSKWEVYIPSELAYGSKSPGSPIPPNAPLVFDIEVLGTKPTPPQPAQPEIP